MPRSLKKLLFVPVWSLLDACDKTPPYHADTQLANLYAKRRDTLLSCLLPVAPKPGWETTFAYQISKLDVIDLFFGLRACAFLVSLRVPFFAFDRKFVLYVRDYADRGFDPEYWVFQEIVRSVL